MSLASCLALPASLAFVLAAGCRRAPAADPIELQPEPPQAASSAAARAQPPPAEPPASAEPPPATPAPAPPLRRTAEQARALVAELPEVKALQPARVMKEVYTGQGVGMFFEPGQKAVWVQHAAAPDCVGGECWHWIDAGNDEQMRRKQPGQLRFRVHARSDEERVQKALPGDPGADTIRWVPLKPPPQPRGAAR